MEPPFLWGGPWQVVQMLRGSPLPMQNLATVAQKDIGYIGYVGECWRHMMATQVADIICISYVIYVDINRCNLKEALKTR